MQTALVSLNRWDSPIGRVKRHVLKKANIRRLMLEIYASEKEFSFFSVSSVGKASFWVRLPAGPASRPPLWHL
jgi:hypothetical protein